MTLHQALTRTNQILASTELAIALFGAICLFAIPGTLMEKREIYSNPFFLALLGLLGLNLAFCTLNKFKAVSKPVLIIHSGVLLTLVGCVVSSFGFVATVNIYEGTMVDQVYRWDMEADVPLGIELTVKRIQREYYPIPIRVGVLKGEGKVGLFTLKTGEYFSVGTYRIRAESLSLPAENLKLTVLQGERPVGSYETSGRNDLPADFPYSFKLVAFQNPKLKRLWVDLLLSRSGETIAEGTSEVNAPFEWAGLSFFNTQVDRDPQGRAFAGIQIVKDPGRPYVFFGFTVTCLGAVLAFVRRFFRKTTTKSTMGMRP